MPTITLNGIPARTFIIEDCKLATAAVRKLIHAGACFKCDGIPKPECAEKYSKFIGHPFYWELKELYKEWDAWRYTLQPEKTIVLYVYKPTGTVQAICNKLEIALTMVYNKNDTDNPRVVVDFA